jgi:hypothetical protein
MDAAKTAAECTIISFAEKLEILIIHAANVMLKSTSAVRKAQPPVDVVQQGEHIRGFIDNKLRNKYLHPFPKEDT